MDTEKTGSEVLTQEQDSQVEQTASGASPEKSDTGVGQQKQQADGYVEEWACHFGGSKARKQGRRVLEFNERLYDVADQVSLCLGVLPVVAETAASAAWGPRAVNGFTIITEIVSEAAIKTITSLEQERRALQKQNQALQNHLSTGDAKARGKVAQL